MPEFVVPHLVVPEPGPHPGPAPEDDHAPAGPAMVAGELVPGDPDLGVPTVDSDADGTADTVVAEIADELVLATDLDHDGLADAVTRIGPDGVATARAGETGHEQPWDAPPPPAPSVDPHTGEWTRG